VRRVAMAEDRETAEKLREFFRSQGIDAEIRESGAEFEILVPDSKELSKNKMIKFELF